MKLRDYLREAVENALDEELLAMAMESGIAERINYDSLAEYLLDRISDEEIMDAALAACERGLPF